MTQFQEFDVFGPKAIAGAFPDVGKIPEALRSRSVHLRMKRKLPGEQVDRWTRQTREATADTIATLREDLAKAVADADPSSVHVELVDEIGDRDFDIWEPLLAVAERAGYDWLSKALDAAIALCAPDASGAVPLRIQLLRDLAEIWKGRDPKKGKSGDPHMLTETILERLHRMPERPWADYYGSPLSPHKLARILAAYQVESKTEPRIDGKGDKRRKGYYRQDLEDLWARYTPGESSPSSPTSPDGAEPNDSESLESFPERYLKHHPNPKG